MIDISWQTFFLDSLHWSVGRRRRRRCCHRCRFRRRQKLFDKFEFSRLQDLLLFAMARLVYFVGFLARDAKVARVRIDAFQMPFLIGYNFVLCDQIRDLIG